MVFLLIQTHQKGFRITQIISGIKGTLCLSPQHYDKVYVMTEAIKSCCSIHPDGSDLVPESWGGAQATVTLTEDIHNVRLPQPGNDLIRH